MTKSEELAALVERATPGPWRQERDPCDGKDYESLITLPSARNTWVAHTEHNWREADYGERKISWKEAQVNAALIVWCRNNADLIVEALKRMEVGDDRG